MRNGDLPRVSGHWDLDLKRWLLASGVQHRVGASYIAAPVGSYRAHPSGRDARFTGPAGRPPLWDLPWCCQGTRRSQDSRDRSKYVCGWTARGKRERIGQLTDNPGPQDHQWRTFWARQNPRPTPTGEAEAGDAAARSSRSALGGQSSQPAPSAQTRGRFRREQPFSAWARQELPAGGAAGSGATSSSSAPQHCAGRSLIGAGCPTVGVRSAPRAQDLGQLEATQLRGRRISGCPMGLTEHKSDPPPGRGSTPGQQK